MRQLAVFAESVEQEPPILLKMISENGNVHVHVVDNEGNTVSQGRMLVISPEGVSLVGGFGRNLGITTRAGKVALVGACESEDQ